MTRFFACLILFVMAGGVHAEVFRIATFNTELSRTGPGLLLRDILKRDDPQVTAVVETITDAQPDILILQGVDWDYENLALASLQGQLLDAGLRYPYFFSRQPNSGITTGLDMDGDGRAHGPGDTQGYGNFTGKGGLAILSRFPILPDAATDFSSFLWKDLNGALLPHDSKGNPFPSQQALDIQRLSSTGHWVVPIALPNGSRLDILTFQAAPPVFDGPEDRNGKRNHDEIRFWTHVLDGLLPVHLSEFFILAGGANLDPTKGDGRHQAIQELLAHSRLQDPLPSGENGSTDTVVWPTTGGMRVDYILPSESLLVQNSGLQSSARSSTASRHRLVWVDVSIP